VTICLKKKYKTMPVICRRLKTHNEYYVIANGALLTLPDSVPAKFTNRILASTKDYILVESARFSHPVLATKSDMHAVWITANDCVEKGGKPHCMSIPIHASACQSILSVSVILKDTPPLVVYHGTAVTNVNAILKSGLQESFGMLGNAIYGANVWKATRFACFGQDYVRRAGALFRVLLFPATIAEFPRNEWSCTCERCKLKPCSVICDHLALWKDFHQIAHANVTPSKGEKTRTGHDKFLLKNEEWAFSKAAPHTVTHYALIEDASVPTHYDPENRDASIA